MSDECFCEWERASGINPVRVVQCPDCELKELRERNESLWEAVREFSKTTTRLRDLLEKLSENLAEWHSQVDHICTKDMKWWEREIDAELSVGSNEPNSIS